MIDLLLASLPNESDYVSKIIPNWVSFVTQLGAFIVMIIVVIFLAYKPVKKMLKKRQDYIEENIREAEINKAEAIKNNRASSEIIIASKKEADAIISKAHEMANQQASAMLEETKNQITNMKLRAEEDIKRSQIEALDTIRQEMVNVAFEASENLLKREVTSTDNQQLVEDFIKDKVN